MKAHRALEIVRGTKVRPAPLANDATKPAKKEHENQKVAWFKSDAMAQKFIVTIISEYTMIHIINCTNCKEIWEQVESVCEQKSDASTHMLRYRWLTVTKDKADGIAGHTSKRAWESTAKAERTKANLMARLTIEEFRQTDRAE